jgi:hypothetical protein
VRSALVIPALLLVGCGPTHSAEAPTPQQQTVYVAAESGGQLRMTSSTTARVDTLWSPFDRTWSLMPTVFATLEIPIESFNSETGTIGNSGMKLYRRLGKTPLTRVLDCGATQIGPNADSYEVMLSVLSKVQRARADTSKTTVATTVEATARPIQFRGDPVRCSSKGLLEARVLEVLKVHLAP